MVKQFRCFLNFAGLFQKEKGNSGPTKMQKETQKARLMLLEDSQKSELTFRSLLPINWGSNPFPGA